MVSVSNAMEIVETEKATLVQMRNQAHQQLHWFVEKKTTFLGVFEFLFDEIFKTVGIDLTPWAHINYGAPTTAVSLKRVSFRKC